RRFQSGDQYLLNSRRGTVDGSARWYHVFFWLHRKASLLPGAPTSDQSARIRPTGSSQLARRPGARRFVHSGTVEHQRRVLLKPQRAGGPNDVVGRHANGAPRAERVVPIGAIGADVDQEHRRVAGPQGAELVNRYSFGRRLLDGGNVERGQRNAL